MAALDGHDNRGGARSVLPADLSSAPPERFAYSYGVRHGSTLWISGQVALDETGNIVGEGDVERQTEQVFANLLKILRAAGGSLDNLVSTTTYMTDPGYSPQINEVRKKHLTGDVKPTSTLVTVAALARPSFLVEIAAVAVLPTDESG